jgi:hypothetical protein
MVGMRTRSAAFVALGLLLPSGTQAQQTMYDIWLQTGPETGVSAKLWFQSDRVVIHSSQGSMDSFPYTLTSAAYESILSAFCKSLVRPDCWVVAGVNVVRRVFFFGRDPKSHWLDLSAMPTPRCRIRLDKRIYRSVIDQLKNRGVVIAGYPA